MNVMANDNTDKETKKLSESEVLKWFDETLKRVDFKNMQSENWDLNENIEEIIDKLKPVMAESLSEAFRIAKQTDSESCDYFHLNDILLSLIYNLDDTFNDKAKAWNALLKCVAIAFDKDLLQISTRHHFDKK
jgi:hypothetical protein